MQRPIMLTTFATFLLATTSASALPISCPPETQQQPLVIQSSNVDYLLQSQNQSVAERIGNNRTGYLVVSDGRNEVQFQTLLNVVQDDENIDLRIESENGELTITLNGKEVSEDHYSLEDDRLTIEDEHGNIIFDHDVHFGHGAGDGNGEMHFEMNFDDDHSIHGDNHSDDQPKGRIGLTMDTVSEALAWHLGIQNEGAFMIVDVVPGLPAEKAGLEPWDIIIRVNDQSAEQDMFRDLVQQSEPGTEIRLEIIHKGERKTVNVKTTSWESDEAESHSHQHEMNDAHHEEIADELEQRHRILLERIERDRAKRDEQLQERFEELRQLDIDVEDDIDIHFDVEHDRHNHIEHDNHHEHHGNNDEPFQFDIELGGEVDLGMLNQLLNREFDREDLHDAIIRLERQPFVREFRNGLMRGKIDASIDGLHIDPDMIHDILEGVMEEIEVEFDDDVRRQIESALDQARQELRNHLQKEDGDDLLHDHHHSQRGSMSIDLGDQENIIFEMLEDGKRGDSKVMILMRDEDGKHHTVQVDELGGKIELKAKDGDRIQAKRIQLKKDAIAEAKDMAEEKARVIAEKKKRAIKDKQKAKAKSADNGLSKEDEARARKLYDRINRLKKTITELEAELAKIKDGMKK